MLSVVPRCLFTWLSIRDRWRRSVMPRPSNEQSLRVTSVMKAPSSLALWELNTRPRKTLGWRTPAEVFFAFRFVPSAMRR